MTSPLIAVVGLKREAALVVGPGLVTEAGGGDGVGLRARLERRVAAQPARAVVSVGIGGALAAALKVGDWVLADQIVGPQERWRTDPGLLQALRRGLPTALTGAIAAGDVVVADVAGKAALHAATGALAVDMESHVAARFAAEHGIPFAALRVISDTADQALPKAVMVSMKPDGGLNLPAVLRSLALDPRQLPTLIRTGREAGVAFSKLKLLGRDNLLGRLGIGDPDLGQLALDVV